VSLAALLTPLGTNAISFSLSPSLFRFDGIDCESMACLRCIIWMRDSSWRPEKNFWCPDGQIDV
jgi:hypothetical protein